MRELKECDHRIVPTAMSVERVIPPHRRRTTLKNSSAAPPYIICSIFTLWRFPPCTRYVQGCGGGRPLYNGGLLSTRGGGVVKAKTDID